MNKLEQEARASSYCFGCGEEKVEGCVVCWDCFKYADAPFKDHKGTLQSWINIRKSSQPVHA